MRELEQCEIDEVSGCGYLSWMASWAAGEALDWLVKGGFQKMMTSYGQAVENGQGLPGSSGVAA